jgi:hypothetical protein
METANDNTTAVMDLPEDEEEKTVFTFDELDEGAKNNFRYQWAEWMQPEECSDFVVEGYHEKLEALGYSDLDWSWSGFSSQGDGASFTGSFDFSGENLKRVLGQETYDQLIGILMVFRLHGVIEEGCAGKLSLCGKVTRNSHRYSHEHTVSCDGATLYLGDTIYWSVDELPNVLGESDETDELCESLRNQLEAIENFADKAVLEDARSHMRDFYRDLEKEYDYQLSDEHLSEICDANEYRFDENGRLL